jgi:hypothetical protein
MTYKLTPEDIAAIELFIERNHSLDPKETSLIYGWQTKGVSIAFAGCLRKIGVNIPQTKRRIESLKNSVEVLALARKKFRGDMSEFRAWKAEREKTA